MTLTDDKIQEIIDSIDFSQMVTADDIFFMVARAIEKESQAKITDLENRLEAAQDELKVAAKLISDWVDHGQEMFNTIQALQSQSPAPVSETPSPTEIPDYRGYYAHLGTGQPAPHQPSQEQPSELPRKLKAAIDNAIEILEHHGDEWGIAENLRESLAQPSDKKPQPSKEQVRDAFNKFEIEAVAYGASQNMSSKKMDAAKAELLALLQSQPKQSTEGSEDEQP